LKVGLVTGCAKTLNEGTVYGHYNEIESMFRARRPNRWT